MRIQVSSEDRQGALSGLESSKFLGQGRFSLSLVQICWGTMAEQGLKPQTNAAITVK